MSVGSRGSLRVSNQDDRVCTVQSVWTSFAACVPAVGFRVHYPAVLLPVSGKPLVWSLITGGMFPCGAERVLVNAGAFVVSFARVGKP